MAGRGDQVRSVLQQAGINVQDLKVKDMESVITIHGTVDTPEVKARAEQAVEAATGTKVANHLETRQSATAAPAAGQSASSAGTGAAGAQQYTIQSGDTLSKIAKKFYGDAAKWPKIRDANRAKIPNPDLIRAGDTLTIPAGD